MQLIVILIPQSRDGHAPAAQQDLRDALECAALDVLVLVVDQLERGVLRAELYERTLRPRVTVRDLAEVVRRDRQRLDVAGRFREDFDEAPDESEVVLLRGLGVLDPEGLRERSRPSPRPWRARPRRPPSAPGPTAVSPRPLRPRSARAWRAPWRRT